MTVHAYRACVCGHDEAMHAANRGPCQKCVGEKACQRFRPRKQTESLVRAFIGHSELANLDNPIGKEQEQALRALHAAIGRVLTAFGAPPTKTKRKAPREVPKLLWVDSDVSPTIGGPPKPPTQDNGELVLSRCALELLRVLASRQATTRTDLAVLSGYSVTSGGFSESLATLRALGLIEGDGGLRVTAAGRQRAPTSTGQPRELLPMWLAKLGKCERTILDALCACPTGLTRKELAGISGYSETSGGFSGAIAKLRKLELVTSGSPMLAHHLLMPKWGQT